VPEGVGSTGVERPEPAGSPHPLPTAVVPSVAVIRALRGAALLASPALAGAGVLLALACSSAAPVRTLPALPEAATDPAAGYEAPTIQSASELLPPELLQGPDHEVADEVVSDGLRRHYWISSPWGELEAVGDAQVRRRVAEVRALAALEEMSRTRAFAEAASRGLVRPFVATWNLIRHPVDSLTGIPTGAWEQLQRVASLATEERSELEDGALRAFLGFEARKRKLAARLGVDPYTSNRLLQRELNRAAWVSVAGGLPFALVPFTEVGEPEPSSPAATAAEGRLEGLLDRFSPLDLARFNRIELTVMGVPEPVREAFLEHPWYSPRHETLLVAALAALDPAPGRRDFVEAALGAASEGDAFDWQRTAELLRAYHGAAAPVERLVILGGGRPAGHSAEGTLVVPLAADHVFWTGLAEAIAEAVEQELRDAAEVATAELVVAGTLSPRARAGFESRGFSVIERAFERLRVEDPAAVEGAALGGRGDRAAREAR